ncbi:MAG: hypothetical protein ACLSX0_01185 [Anaerostipes caccae]|jgi:hypothetical protein
MLRVNRLKIIINTDNGEYGFDEKFYEGLNFIASPNNTCGKSSVIEGIYYGLGFEQIIGGEGEKVLTDAYKSFIKDGDNVYTVLQSKIYLEISNGVDDITILRTAKMEGRKSKLITVYYCKMDHIEDEDIEREDMYVLSPNAALNKKGFHNFLEKFLGLSLPTVPTSDDKERKLYLQLLFSAMFIEQKRGWADLFSAMPYLGGIKDSKKRIVEFLIGLETIENEKKRNELSQKEKSIKQNWESVLSTIHIESNRINCKVQGVPSQPEILELGFEKGVHVFKSISEKFITIETYITELKSEYEQLSAVVPKIADNYDEIEEELFKTEACIEELMATQSDIRKQYNIESFAIKKLQDELDNIKIDIVNNKDAKKLRDLGSKIDSEILGDICPVCHQPIQDSLLPYQNKYVYMSIDDNIKHLNAQKEMYEFALNARKQRKIELDGSLKQIVSKISTLTRLAKSLRNDISSVDENISESIVFRKFEISKEIEDLENISELIKKQIEKLRELSFEWSAYLQQKSKIPKNKFSKNDYGKLKALQNNFIRNLENYAYSSIDSLDKLEISKETYLPTVENFDMKYGSSASDGIRAIWAFTMALMQTSIEKLGNHVNMLIFDEPDQHSIIMEDLKSFIDSILLLKEKSQVILGITIKDQDTKEVIENLDPKNYHMIEIKTKAFMKID